MITCASTRTRTDGGSSGVRRQALGRAAVLGALLLNFTGLHAWAADWPVARGDLAGTAVAKATLPDELAVRWKYVAKDSAFEATAVVAAGVVYVGDADGTVHAVRLKDGESVWRKAFEEASFASAGTVQGERLYLGDIDGVVRCLKTADGELVWRHDTVSELYAAPHLFSETLLVTTESGVLLALEAKTGAERWRFAIDAPLRCAATIVDGRTLLAGCDGKLHAVDLKTGKEVGAVEIGSQTGNSAALAGSRAFFGAESGEFMAVDVKDPQAMAVAWTYRDPRRGQGIRTAAAASPTLVTYGSNGKAIYGLDPKSGDKRWVTRVRSRVESSPVIVTGNPAGARVLAATMRGRLLAIDATTGDIQATYNAGGSFIASPAVAGDSIIIGNTDGTLYCFGK